MQAVEFLQTSGVRVAARRSLLPLAGCAPRSLENMATADGDIDRHSPGAAVTTICRGDHQGMVTEFEWLAKEDWFEQVAADGLQLPEAETLFESVPRRLLVGDKKHHGENEGADNSHVYLYSMTTKVVDGPVLFKQSVTQHRVGRKRARSGSDVGGSSSLRRLASTERLGDSQAAGADDEPFDSQETLR